MNCINLIGKRFGKLQVVSFAPQASNKSYRWICKCDCGKLKKIKQTSLLDGTVKSCGCDLTYKNIIGKKFGRLTVIDKVFENHKTLLICKCDCGNITKREKSKISFGDIKSCGCLGNEIHSKGNPTHGLYYTRIYKIYNGMKNRCYCKTDYHYKEWGGRGITICDEWLGKNGFVNFHNWAISNGYDDSLSIDRIDNNGNYCPENCRWATSLEQQSNTRKNKWIEYNNEKLTFSQLSRKLGIHTSTLYHRLKKYNGDIDKALQTPINHNLNRYKEKSGN